MKFVSRIENNGNNLAKIQNMGVCWPGEGCGHTLTTQPLHIPE